MANMTRILLATVLLFSLSAPSRAAVTVYTDQAAWQAALAGSTFITQDFNGAASSFLENSTGNPVGSVTTVDLIGGVGDPGPTGLTGTGFLEGEVDSSSKLDGDGLDLRFNTPRIIGFGLLGLQNHSESTPGGLDLEEIGIEVDGERFLVSDILGLTNSSDGNEVPNTENTAPIPFIGFITTNEVTSFKLIHGDFVAPGGVEGGNEDFYLNALVLAQSQSTAPTSIPTLSEWGMIILSSLLALGTVLVMRRQRL